MEDKKLSENFSLFDLTRTDHVEFQEENRKVTPEELEKLARLAALLEECRAVLGGGLDIHSGRRCLALNRRVGGSEKSQHLKCEAADISPLGPDTEAGVADAWQKLATAARQKKLKFGQLIFESASDGREGRKFWVHISLGAPYRDAARCGEVLTMKDGKYTTISQIS